MQIVAGVDGGGTRTRVALADSTGQLLGLGVSGPSNYGSIPMEKVQAHIGEAFQAAFDQAGLESSRVDALFMGMAGVVNEADRKTIRQMVHKLDAIDPKNVSVDHDIRISLAGGLAGKEGIALIAGTGSSCYGRREDGNSWMAGGWGHLLDDRGSAFDLVRQSLIAVVRAEDGRGKPTMLTELMMRGLQIDDISEIMRRLYYEGSSGEGIPMNKEEIASLAPLVIRAAKEDDEIAKKIIKDGVRELALMVRTVANSIDFSGDVIPIIITGGLARHSPYVNNLLYDEIQKEVRGSRIYEPRFKPVIGAVLLALQMVDKNIDQPIIENLKSTLPSRFEENEINL